MHGWRPEIGDRRTFVPSSFMPENGGPGLASIKPGTEVTVSGTVVYINKAHRWCRVRYETATGPQYECFKF